MLAPVLIAAALTATPASTPERAVAIRSGIVIDYTTTLRRGTYRIASTGVDAPVLTIRGSNIDLDLSGVELIGSPESATPDQYKGLAILIDGGEHVSIRNARIRGFKVGILARNVKDLRLSGNDVSRNWKQRLYSRVEKESLVDWMSYHQNEKDEWLRYGAGIYLTDIDGGRLDLRAAARDHGRRRPDRPQRRAPGPERADDHALAQSHHLEQRVLVPVEPRHRDVPRHRQQGDAQPHRLVRARVQPRLLQPRPGLRGPADV